MELIWVLTSFSRQVRMRVPHYLENRKHLTVNQLRQIQASVIVISC